MPEVTPAPTVETQIAVLQTNFIHLTDSVKELKVGQDKMQGTIERMNEKLDTAYVSKDEFFKFQNDLFNPVKKRVDSLWWNLGLFIGGGGVLVTLINWYLIVKYH